jgi:hypothetical protein
MDRNVRFEITDENAMAEVSCAGDGESAISPAGVSESGATNR